MKKTFKTMLALMAGAMTFTGCTSDILENTPEQIPSALKPMTFTATQESDATRAAIVGTAINWTTGDKISIFDGGEADEDGNLAREFALTGGENTPSGTFTGEAIVATTYYALYPYASSTYEENGVTVDGNYLSKIGIDWQELITGWEDYHSKNREKSMDDFIEGVPLYSKMSAENKAIIKAYLSNEEYKEITKSGPQLNAGKIEGVAFPAAQTATVGTADPKAMLMIGTSDDTKNIQFKNVCAYLKVTPTFACTSIVLKSNGTESLAGTVTLDYNEGNPTTTVTNGTNTVTLSGTIAANSTYYIAVLPATLASGFTVEFKDADNKVIGSKSTTKENVAFARNKVINLGSFNMYPPEGSNGSATRTGSNAEVKWVQLWEDGPKFAEYNVGATSVTDYGDYYTWGGIINKDPSKTYNNGTVALTGEDDTATKLWGSNWRMPTKEEFEKLRDNCTVQWVTNYKNTGVNGKLFTGTGAYAANSIFFPAIGYYNGANVLGLNAYANCWTSTPSTYMGLDPTKVVIGTVSREWGYSIRPVLVETPATTGKAKATIGGSEVDVNWVQLWENGPKFAEYNVADKMYFEDAAKTGTGYVWGANWRTPSKDELDELVKAASSAGSEKVTCVYGQVSGNWVFTFTGKEEGYTGNSVFFPATGSDFMGAENYWSSTEEDEKNGYKMRLFYDSEGFDGKCLKDSKSYTYLVRPVLAE